MAGTWTRTECWGDGCHKARPLQEFKKTLAFLDTRVCSKNGIQNYCVDIGIYIIQKELWAMSYKFPLTVFWGATGMYLLIFLSSL